MILTQKLLDKLRYTGYFCSKLNDEHANRLLLLYSKEPAPEPPYVWDEEHIWLTLRKMIRSNQQNLVVSGRSQSMLLQNK